jgi:alkylhydroperoxidase family enzyme
VGSELGIAKEKILALADYETSALYDEAERAALAYAEAITITDRGVSDEIFARVRAHYNEAEIVELTAIIAWENASSKFNRALRVPSQNLWRNGGNHESKQS